MKNKNFQFSEKFESLTRTLLAVCFCLTVSVVNSSCRKISSGQQGVSNLSAINTEERHQTSKAFISIWNENFTTKFSELATSGRVDDQNIPRAGYWYPQRHGGTNVRMTGGQSPLEKYDLAFNNGQLLATNWEVEYHSCRQFSEEQCAWTGHCNGFSAAGQRHPREPFQAVEKNGVSFSPQDIKALLAETYMSADFIFLGGARYDGNNQISHTPSSRPVAGEMSAFEDVNPGTFHLVVGNWIGKKKHIIIIDQNADNQVWNYPLFQYNVLPGFPQDISEDQAVDLVNGADGQSKYIYNENAVAFKRVRTSITYVNALNDGESLGVDDSRKSMFLDYVLELDGAGNIIGGEWIGESQNKHPDFMWVALPPLATNGHNLLANPHVDYKSVLELWAVSAGYSATNYPRGIERPETVNDWGKWEEFSVTLDGSSIGSVFAGKPTVLGVRRGGALRGQGVSAEVFLNGRLVTKMESDPFEHSFEPLPGLHTLTFIWKNQSTQLEKETVSFVVMR